MVEQQILIQIAAALHREFVRFGTFTWTDAAWPFADNTLGFTCFTTRSVHLRHEPPPLLRAHVLLHEAVHLFLQPAPPTVLKPDAAPISVCPDGSVPASALKGKFTDGDDDPMFRVCCGVASLRLFGAPLPADYDQKWPINAPNSAPMLHAIARQLEAVNAAT